MSFPLIAQLVISWTSAGLFVIAAGHVISGHRWVLCRPQPSGTGGDDTGRPLGRDVQASTQPDVCVSSG
jgi:hypothetical protein